MAIMVSWKRSCIFIGVLCAVAKSMCAELSGACNTANEEPECTVTNSECVTNVCKCKEGYIEVDAACEKAVSGITCTDGTECEIIPNAECDETTEKCKCSDGYVMNLDVCDPENGELDSVCNTANGQPACTVTNSECLENVCKCKQGYKEVDAACEKELDSVCNPANGQPVCTVTNSECQNNVCKCKQGYREIDAACDKELGGACNTANEELVCTVTNSECVTNVCKCKEGYIEVDAACEKAVSGITCTDGTECDNIPKAECDETTEKCKCSDGYVMNLDVCDPENGAATLRIEAAAIIIVFAILAVLQITG